MHNTLAASDYGLLDENTLAPRPKYLGRAVVAAVDGNHGARRRRADSIRPSRLRPLPTRHARRRVLLVINTDRDAPHALMLPVASMRYTLEAASLLDGDVRLNGRTLALSAGDELPAIAGAPTPPATVMFRAGHHHLPGHSGRPETTHADNQSNAHRWGAAESISRLDVRRFLGKAGRCAMPHAATNNVPGSDRFAKMRLIGERSSCIAMRFFCASIAIALLSAASAANAADPDRCRGWLAGFEFSQVADHRDGSVADAVFRGRRQLHRSGDRTA